MPLSQMGTISSTICAMFLRGSEAGGDGEVGRMYFGIGCYETLILLLSSGPFLSQPPCGPGEIIAALGPALSALAPDQAVAGCSSPWITL